MINKFILFLCACSLTIGLYAAEPKAVIEPSRTTAAIHEPVWLKTNTSVGKSFTWKVIPPAAEENFTQLPIFGGIDKNGQPIVSWWGHYSSATPGTLYFIFIATEDNKSDIAIQMITYGGGDVPPVVPTPDIQLPSADIVLLVKPLTAIVKDKADARKLQQFYLDMASVVKRDTKEITDTEKLRKINITAGTLMFQKTGLKEKYPGLGEAIDKVLAAKLGLEIVPITDTKRQDIVEIFTGIAWAFSQVGK